MERLTHLVFGFFLFTLLYSMLEIPFSHAVFVLIGAVFPDLDFKRILRALHRKLFHNLWAIGLVALLAFYFLRDLSVPIAFVFGALTHLLADSFTPTGVTPLWPISLKFSFYKYVRIKTGSLSEKVFCAVLVFLSVILLYRKFFSGLLW